MRSASVRKSILLNRSAAELATHLTALECGLPTFFNPHVVSLLVYSTVPLKIVLSAKAIRVIMRFNLASLNLENLDARPSKTTAGLTVQSGSKASDSL